MKARMLDGPRWEPLEPRLMLDGVDYVGDPPAELFQATIVVSIIPGDLTGDHRIDLADFVYLKRSDPADLLGRFEALKVNFGDDARTWEIHADPALADPNYTYTTIVGSLITDGATADDAHQGDRSDCWLIASMAAIADSDPAAISGMIGELGDGTYVVKIHDLAGMPEYYRLDADLPVNADGRLVYAHGDLWVSLLEKAAAERYHTNDYGALGPGWPATAYMMLTGDAGTSEWVANYTDLEAELTGYLADGLAVTLVSKTTDVGQVIGNHVYALVDAGPTLWNPHGYYLSLTWAEIEDAFRLVTFL